MIKIYDNKRNKNKTKEQNPSKTPDLSKSLENNIDLFKNIFSNDETLVIRKLQNKHSEAIKCALLYIDGMVDNKILNQNILEPLMSDNMEGISTQNLLEELQYKVIASNNIKESDKISELSIALISGDTLLLAEGFDKALIISSKGWKTRSIAEPEAEKVVRGPREGFTEAIMVNLSMVRRKIKSHELKFRFKELGVRSLTKTCICYIDDIASKEIIDELETRLDKIDLDAILDSGYIQELIKDAPFSPFHTIGSTERPDVVAARLLEGRVAVFVDGSPTVLTLPYLFMENFQASEDYYNNYIFASMNRIIRVLGGFLSISVPAIYLSLVTFHQEMLPTPLLLSVAAAREGVPFPTNISLMMMLAIFDSLREAGTRMPTPIGQAVNIVGALVLGQAAVDARLVSASVVIVTAFTGITALLNINTLGANLVLRTLFLILSSIIGIYGYLFGFIALVIHLSHVRSFGVPYLLHISNFKEQEIKDTAIRAPWWTMRLRPKLMAVKNAVRKPKTKTGVQNTQ